MLKNHLISILDQTFPSTNTLFFTPARGWVTRNGWISFKYPHSECISKKSFYAFSKNYLSWHRKFGYNFSESKARTVYDFACNGSPSSSLTESTALLVSNAISQPNYINKTLAALASALNFRSSPALFRVSF